MEFPEEYRDAVADATADVQASVEVSNPNEADQGIKVPRVLILFGSETGTAEAAAFRLQRKLKLCKPHVASLNEVAGLDIVKERGITKLIALTSTFGTGDPPSNADVFASTKIPDGILEETDCAVLALGSTLYPDFCKAGIALDMQLRKAGGKQMVPLKKVDDSVGSEAPIAQWIDLMTRLVMPDNLKKVLEARAGTHKSTICYELTWKDETGNVNEEVERVTWPEEASSLCLENEELMENGDVDTRSTRKITFAVPEGESYVSGDHLAVHPLNSMTMVRRFAACFGDELVGACPSMDGDRAKFIEYQLQRPFVVDCIENGDRLPARLAFKTPATLGSALQTHIDLLLPSSSVPDFLQMIKKALSPEGDEGPIGDGIAEKHGFSGKVADKCRQLTFLIKDIVERQGDKSEQTELFTQSYPTCVDFLEAFGPVLCTFGSSQLKKGPLLMLADILPMLPKLRPRHYSISSSSRKNPRKVSISVGVVHVETTKKVMIHGVCSNYLARLKPGTDRAKIAIRGSTFRGPKETSSPMILVGAGTGLAPMMGFIQDRALDVAEFKKDTGKEIGEAHLYFGCRSSKERIYSEVVDGWVEDGTLIQHLAMSREPGVPKKYVQQVLKEGGEELCKLLLRDDTYYYICGDAKVGDECYEACVNVLRMHGDMSRVGAAAHIKRMRVENRWQFDLWGIISHFIEAKRQVKKAHKQRSSEWLKSFQ